MGDSQINQTFSSISEIVPALEMILPKLNKEDSATAKAVRDLIETIKDKNEGKIKESISTVSDLMWGKWWRGAIVEVKALLGSSNCFKF